MPKITLTDLVDVVSKSGSPKATKVAQIKNREPYAPAQDFYKIFRTAVVETHKHQQAKSELKEALVKTSDPKRKTHYEGMIAGYQKWWGKKSIGWFSPPAVTYTSAGVEVSVNPELGLIINGVHHVVKLYLKSESLPKQEAMLILVLMEHCLRDKIKGDVRMTIVDVKRAKSFDYELSSKPLKPMIDAELAYISTLWPSV